MRKLFLLLFFITIPTIHAHTVFIIIHGTWAGEHIWHKPGGDFFENFVQNIKDKDTHVVSFTWSGKSNFKSRKKAGYELAQFIRSYPLDTTINIIAHSHGGNVCILASQILAENPNNHHSINLFYALGVPVHKQYQPNMSVINYVYNFFSFEDLIQTILGMYTREFFDHERIANIRIIIDGRQPSHSDLHHPIIGKWLFSIHKELMEKQIGNFESFIFKQPGIIYLSSEKEPIYEIDNNRKVLRERDRQLALFMHQAILEEMGRTNLSKS